MAIDGGPELVQLLTPEGVLVEHPDYALSLTDSAWRHRYADLVMVRRLDAEATALQRHGELGPVGAVPGPGGRPGGRGPGHPRRPTGSSRPTASTGWPTCAASTR